MKIKETINLVDNKVLSELFVTLVEIHDEKTCHKPENVPEAVDIALDIVLNIFEQKFKFFFDSFYPHYKHNKMRIDFIKKSCIVYDELMEAIPESPQDSNVDLNSLLKSNDIDQMDEHIDRLSRDLKNNRGGQA